MSRRRRGVALLEAIVALTILTVAGVALLSMSATGTRVSSVIVEMDVRLLHASAFLDVVALWSREELDMRLGERPQGPFLLQIARPTTTLYRIVLRDSLTAETLLVTSLFRPEAPNASR